MRAACLLAILALAGCSGAYPQFVMVNRETGAVVNCQYPDRGNGSGEYLATQACLSACEAHGFRPVPNVTAPPGDLNIPEPCGN